MFIPIWGRFPFWFIFFKRVGSTTNQNMIFPSRNMWTCRGPELRVGEDLKRWTKNQTTENSIRISFFTISDGIHRCIPKTCATCFCLGNLRYWNSKRNGKCIFSRSIFHCYVSLPKCILKTFWILVFSYQLPCTFQNPDVVKAILVDVPVRSRDVKWKTSQRRISGILQAYLFELKNMMWCS